MGRLAAFLLLASLAHAQRTPVLAELFTSEGCSSCPPADALLQKLDGEVVVLSEHVDYWDQLGWRDPNSSHEFTARQERYARAIGVETYTPQLVIDGRAAVLGNDVDQVRGAIQKAAARPHAAVRITAAKRERNEAAVTISIPALAKGKADVWVGVAAEATRSNVKHGENAGHTLTHVAVLRSLTKAGTVGKSGGMETTLRVRAAAEPSRVVVFLTDSGGQVNGAASARLP
jgi:hypothetical protein